MSWSERLQRAALAVALMLPLTQCVQPLYAPGLLGKDGTTDLASIEVAPIPNRLGHYLRTDLQFALGGGSIPDAPLYRLAVVATPGTRTAVADRYLAQADSVSYVLTATYTLTRLSDAAIVTTGSVTGSSSYERSDQRYATVRAARTAEERAARVVSDQIRTRLAAVLAAAR
jgi:LPS-assembly lipoprotein